MNPSNKFIGPSQLERSELKLLRDDHTIHPNRDSPVNEACLDVSFTPWGTDKDADFWVAIQGVLRSVDDLGFPVSECKGLQRCYRDHEA